MKRRLLRSLFVACLFLRAQAAPVQWEVINPYPTPHNLNSVAFGAGVFVAVGNANTILYSHDNGATWLEAKDIPRSGESRFAAVKFANNVFVVVGNSGQSYTSADGKNWTPHPLAGDFRTITFGAGLFAVGGNVLATSPDGTTWTYYTGVAQQGLHLSAYGNGRFLFKEQSLGSPWSPNPQTFVTSPDGVNWTRFNGVVPLPENCGGRLPPCTYLVNFSGLTFLNGQFYGNSFVSPDGVVWTRQNSASSYREPDEFGFLTSDLETVNGLAVIMGGSLSTPISSSADLVTWSPASAGTDGLAVLGITYGNSNYVVVGANGLVLKGSNLNALGRIDSLEKTNAIVSVASHGDVVVGATGDGGPHPQLLVSTNNGSFFLKSPFPSSISLEAVRYANNQFVAAGGDHMSSVVARSTDGVTWNYVQNASGKLLNDVTFANGQWVAVGNNGTIITSPDAIALTPRVSGVDITLRGVAGGNGIFVAVGDSGALLHSTNGQDWTAQGTVEGTPVRSVVFADGVFVAAGDDGRIYSSNDGLSWAGRRIIGASTLARLAYAHGVYVAMQFENFPAYNFRTYTSTNATNWTRVDIPSTRLHGADSSDGKLWVSGESSAIYREKLNSGIAAQLVNSRFSLQFQAPSAGNYRIFTTTDPTGTSWDSAAMLNNVSGVITWEDSNPISGARYYTIRPEP